MYLNSCTGKDQIGYRKTNHQVVGAILVCAASFLVLLSTCEELSGCTAFFIQNGDQVLVGKNYDWYFDAGLVIANKKRIRKTAYVFPTGSDPKWKGTPARWVSEYGSITFNQYGREFPVGGMNETGLIIEALLMPSTEYQEPSTLPIISPFGWVQYQLDVSRTVHDVVENSRRVRIPNENVVPVHFFTADERGNVAIIEFVSGRMISYLNKDLPVRAMTNHQYKETMAYFDPKSKTSDTQYKFSDFIMSLTRFKKAGNMLGQYDPDGSVPIIDYAFNICDDTSMEKMTQWKIVYNIKEREIIYTTRRKRQTKVVSLRKFTFDNSKPVRIIEVNNDHTGPIDGFFFDYDAEVNRKMVFESHKKTKMFKANETPDERLDIISKYPETATYEVP